MNKSLRYLTCISTLSVSLSHLSPAQSAEQAIQHLQNKNFTKALEILNGDLNKLSNKELTTDQLLLLKARALQFNKQPAKAIETIDQLVKLHPTSPLLLKAYFLKAESLASLKRHDEASLIYQQQAEAAFSVKSKNAGAELLVEVAQTYATEPKESEITEDTPKMDLKKADSLLLEAYDMDCSPALKEQILAQRIQLNTRMSQWQQTTSLCYLYLKQFDPSWLGKLSSIKRSITSDSSLHQVTEDKTITGKHRFQVRYHLSESLHRNNERVSATRYLNELISSLEEINKPDQRALLADAIWLRLMATRRQGGTPRNIPLWIADAEQYLKNYPDHIHASSTAYTIALIQQDAENYLPAITAFQDFIDNKHSIKIIQNSLTHRAETTKEFTQREKKATARKEESSYRIGLLHLQNKEFEKAKATWLETSKNYPNGARWADSQKGLVDIHIQSALNQVTAIEKATTSEEKSAARTQAQQAIHEFISTHPLNKEVPSLLYLSGNIHYIHANQIEKQIKEITDAANQAKELNLLKETQSTALKNTIEQWEQLITKYPSSSFTSNAQYTIATIYENHTGELEKALSLYKKSNYPQAKNKVISLSSKKLTAFSNKTFTTTEKPFIKINTRNIEELTVKQYWLDIESYFRKGRKLEDISSLDIDLVEADKTWQHKVADYKKLHLIETQLDIPFEKNKAGLCIIKVESKNYTTTSMVMRSDIDIALRAGGINNNELITYAYNARTKKPANKIKVLIADAGKVITTGTTNKEGVLHINDEKLSKIKDLRVLALSAKGAASCDQSSDQLLDHNGFQWGTQKTFAQLFFNRAKEHYLPGEVLPISGLIRHRKGDQFIGPDETQRDYTLTITSNRKLLYTADIVLQEGGIFSHDYTIPTNLSANGSLAIKLDSKVENAPTEEVSSAQNPQHFVRTVYVGKENNPKVNIDLILDSQWVKKHQPITGKVKALYRWGAPYANQKILLQLPGTNKNTPLITDESGTATFTFNPQNTPKSKVLEFRASLPDHQYGTDTEQVLYDPNPFTILAASEHTTIPSGGTTNIEVKTLTPEAKPISKALILELTKVVKVNADPILTATPSMEKFTKVFYKEEVIQKIPLTTDLKTGKANYALKVDKAGSYEIRITSADAEQGQHIAIAKSSITVYDNSSFNGLASLKIQPLVPSQAGKIANLNIWSSADQAVTALLTVETDSILEKRIIKLNPKNNSIALNLDARHCPSARVQVLALSERILISTQSIIKVTNPLTITSTLVKADPSNPYLHKLNIQALDNNNKPSAADLFININNSAPKQKDYTIANPFKRKIGIASFTNSTNTGLLHEGAQEALDISVRNELSRLNNAEDQEIQRFNKASINPALQNTSTIRKLLYRASSYYEQSQFEDSLAEYKAVLRIDPYNQAARRGIQRVSNARSDYYRTAYDQTRANMLAEVDTAWEMTTPSQGLLPNDPFDSSINESANFYAPQNTIPKLTYGNAFSNTGKIINHTPQNDLESLLPAQTKVISIPATGKEIIIDTRFLESSTQHSIEIIGFNKNNAIGYDSVSQTIKLPKLEAPTQPASIKGVPVMHYTDYQLKAGKNNIKLTLPESGTAEKITLAVSSSTSELLNTAVNTNLSSNLGSTTPFHESHPAGKLMAYVSQFNYLSHHKLDTNLQKELLLTINQLCSELTLSQQDNGAWTAVKNRRLSSLTHTAIAYQALNMAKEIKITIEPDTILNAKEWLLSQQKSISTDLYNYRALIQYALASSGDADFAVCNRLFRERKKMDNIGRAIMANTFILIDRKEFAATLISETTQESKISKPEELALHSPILLNSLILEANLALKNVEKVKPSMTLIFQSDIDRGIATRAYSAYFQQADPTSHTLPNREITINGTTIVASDETMAFTIPQKHLKPGENVITTNYQQPTQVTAIISGYSAEKPQQPSADFIIEDRKYYHKNILYNGVPLSSKSTSEVKSAQVGESIRVVLKGKITNKNHKQSLIIEQIPSGFTYLAGSLRGNHSGARIEDNHLVITYSSNPDKYHISYTLIATTPGTSYHRPTILSPYYSTVDKTYNKSHQLTVTKDRSTTPYSTNAKEHYELAQKHFADKNYKEAKQHIIRYNKLKQTSEDPILARMLLWIETADPQPNAQLLADSFEILTERNPELIIPFEKILKVGNAYREIKEYERSSDVFTATLEANFASASYISAVLEDQAEFALSLDYQDKLWLQYPDIGEITTSRIQLGQQIYATAIDKEKSANLGKNPATKKPYTEVELTTMALKYMQQFLTNAPNHEQADDASFSIANVLFALKKYQQVIDHTTIAAVTHKESTYATNFRYMQALGHFWLRNYDKALEAASAVAHENSDDRELAAFITAQIYHANGQPEDAINWYNSIKNDYPDAAESIAYFEQKSISLDEVKVLNSGEKATLDIKFRNIEEAQFQIYRVDLMQLYLREKNLSNISEINLAGINPKYNLNVKLGSGKDYQEVEKQIQLPITDDGAYLVICRGDYLYTSGLILITPLKMEVQEYPESKSVRVNISDKKSGNYLDSVHVKAVGSNEQKIISGNTDLRGIWQGESIASPSTIIAKDKEGRYAFFRSKLSSTAITSERLRRNSINSKAKVDFNSNLMHRQQQINRDNSSLYESKRRSKGKGVEINKARKK